LNWTGDDPCQFAADAPNFGGFVSSTTVIQAEFWKMGQLKAGDTLRYRRVSLDEALGLRKKLDAYLDGVQHGIEQNDFANASPLESMFSPSGDHGTAVIWERESDATRPLTRFRQGGDNHLIVEVCIPTVTTPSSSLSLITC